jgi:tetratricopeptide (TPR) repeat protein
MGLITEPLVWALAVLLGATVLMGSKAVYIQPVVVPASLADAGYEAETVADDIADNILKLERQAVTRARAHQLTLEDDDSVIETVADSFQLTPLMRSLQHRFGFVEYVVRGNMYLDQPNVVFSLEIRRHSGELTEIVRTRPQDQVDELIRDAAEAIMNVTEPQIYCAALLRRAIEQGKDLEEASHCITLALPVSDKESRVGLHNLSGVLRYLQGDQRGALHAFGHALRADRSYAPALLNVGVMYAVGGRHEEAIEVLSFLLRTKDNPEDAQIYAAAYVEWAKSLAKLGRKAEALALFPNALRADPWHAATYFCWAEMVGPGPEAYELRRAGQASLDHAQQTYTSDLASMLRKRQMTGATAIDIGVLHDECG